jgi:hypothetical protein
MKSALRLAPSQDRRDSVRHQVPIPPSFPWMALVGPNLWAATIVNLSASGIAFISTQPYPSGFHTTIELLDRKWRIWRKKHLRVVHCTPCEVNCWRVGGLFVPAFSDAELEVLLP